MRADLIRALPDILREHSDRLGDKVAFADQRRAVTYRELEARTRRLAGHLVGHGLRRGDRVLICLRNRVEMVESYLAVVRAAAVAVPVNPASTPSELTHLLADSGATAVITDGVHAPDILNCPSLPPHASLVVTAATPQLSVRVHDFDDAAVSEPAEPAPDDLGLDEPAWVFYTSGTTGTPKGVVSSQRNCLYSVAASYVPVPGLSEADRVLWPLPMFHSLSHIACLLAVTAVGATAHLLDSPSAADVLAEVRATRATFLAGVPATYHHLVQARRRQPFALPDLRIGLVGGAVAGADLCRAFRESFGVPLVDAYGSTETCGAITMNSPDGPIVDGSCGLPVPGVGVRIVDPQTGHDVPAGVEGEVWVSGPNVMAGYLNDPEATARVIRDGWYRTGDLARRDDAGYVTICGRTTDLIIRGGENVHPEEIEAALRGQPGLADVAAAGRLHDVLAEVPVAYVVPDGSGADVPALIDHCRQELSAFKVPEAVYEVVSVPRTGSGKVQRRLLADQPAALRHTAGGRHEDMLGLEWVPARPGPPPHPTPRSWVVVGPGAADLVAAWPDTAGPIRTANDLETAPAADVTVLLPHTAGTIAGATADLTRDAGDRIVDTLTSWAARRPTGRLVVLTCAAETVLPGDPPTDPAQVLLSAAARLSGTWVIDIDDESTARTILTAIGLGEPRTALRRGEIFAARLTRRPVTDRPLRYAGKLSPAHSPLIFEPGSLVRIMGRSVAARSLVSS